MRKPLGFGISTDGVGVLLLMVDKENRGIKILID